MLIFNNTISYSDPFNIVFLCGNQYKKEDSREKRNILKEYLESNIDGCRAIILEENFIFSATTKQYLSYDCAFLKGLSEVEQLACLYANKIIIIHETMSTAAELGMFAINPSVAQKICLLIPDDISIEEKKKTSFIKLAFLNNNAKSTKVSKVITYYPDIEVVRSSINKSWYNTYFHNNIIGQNLGRNILCFIDKSQELQTIKIRKPSYGKVSTNQLHVDYCIDNRIINIHVHAEALKIQLLSLFFVDSFRKEFRQTKYIKDHISFICHTYENIIKDSILVYEGIDLTDYELRIDLKDSICKFRQAVGYYLYMLQAAKLIVLEQTDDEVTKRKIRITRDLDDCKNKINGVLLEKQVTEFERMKI